MTGSQYESDFLHCIYDDLEPKGRMGRGCHYSIFRVAEWSDVIGMRVTTAQLHDFAVIWDEDHDTRILEAIDRLYVSGLLAPVLFIGERKGGLTLILDAKFWNSADLAVVERYKREVESIAGNLSMDSWCCSFGHFERSGRTTFGKDCDPASLIQDSGEKAATYLRNIDNLWSLGLSSYVPPKAPQTSLDLTPRESIFSV